MDSKKSDVFVQFVEMEDNKDDKSDFINFWENRVQLSRHGRRRDGQV